MAATVTVSLEEILKHKWGYGNRCRKLHIIPSMEHWCVAPCGFEPKGSRGGTVPAEWSQVKDFVIEDAFNNDEPRYDNTLCKKCLDSLKADGCQSP